MSRQIEVQHPQKAELFPPEGEEVKRERQEVLRALDRLESIKPMKLPERVQ
jgi:hypothetical protein